MGVEIFFRLRSFVMPACVLAFTRAPSIQQAIRYGHCVPGVGEEKVGRCRREAYGLGEDLPVKVRSFIHSFVRH